MLSRAAAVKAPRTHNRRRVTGSSGRRREGRESELQRPNMSRRVFTFTVLLLPFMMICCGSGAVPTEGTDSENDSCFTIGMILAATGDEYDPTEETLPPEATNSAVAAPAEGSKSVSSPVAIPALSVTAISSLSVVDVNGMIAVIAQADHEDGSSTVLARIIEPTEGGAVWTLPDSSANNPQTHYAEGTERRKGALSLFNPTAFSKNNSLYLLLYAGKEPRSPEGAVPKSECLYPWLFIGEIKSMDASDKEKYKKITWGNSSLLSSEIAALFQGRSLEYFSASGGTGILTQDGSLVLPINGWTKDKEEFSLILYSGGPNKDWKLSKGLPSRYFAPVIVEWANGRLFMIISCNDGYRKVYESGDNGESWTEAVETLSRVWGNSHNRTGKGVQSGFISATIEGKKVLLVSLPVYSTDNERGRLNLWLSDGRRIADIGPISSTDEDITESALLYRDTWGEELISVYGSRDATGKLSIFSVRLTGQLGLIKGVIIRWREMDKRVLQLYRFSIVEDSLSSVGACSTRMLMNGLVGFLSGSFDGSQWKNEYFGVDAAVHGEVTPNSGGAIFKGVGAGAVWPVGTQGQNQIYYFANTQFTLLATVSIQEVPGSGTISIPLMGVKMNGPNSKLATLLGISYSADKKWEVTFNGVKATAEGSEWELRREYQVALILEDGEISFVYVNGQLLGSSKTMPTGKERLLDISHFYFGGDNGEKKGNRHVKVRNVLLYNRVLSASELQCRLPEEVVQTPRSASPTSPKKYDFGPEDDDFYTVLFPEKVSVLLSNATGSAKKTASGAATVPSTGGPNNNLKKNDDSCMFLNIYGLLLLILLWMCALAALF
ncbi:neutral sphingomyelinase activation associated factor-like protein [Trypanosoma cruzi]|uniref:Neutral sphingomyelinase activation associated factor-like protein n=1 Tax=Trypanosoma cruzi (strain CL Brener) TaxID=353153 RepID=Q4DSD4_TRYCC|nr:neutral sphingomyelinase activation associated factor-like protein [Trypanosoma cruzi]EAN95412.1 neutral sphingomyelinase activation associated factor-like protein [Trypanosoma cruzi]|eukprot:XP_817263.1 neutral sphingomyelinase activation associated factor-like protein [Trypanosoma cruzi strain CL Brener]